MALNHPFFRGVVVAGLLVAALGLSACGRKGALEPPPGAAISTDETGKPVDNGPVKPQKPFILDSLL